MDWWVRESDVRKRYPRLVRVMTTNAANSSESMDIHNPFLPGWNSMSPSKPILIAGLVALGTKQGIVCHFKLLSSGRDR